MPAPICFGSKDILRIRVALLDSVGAPDDGAENGYVSDAVVNFEMTPQVETGEEFTVKRGDGRICQTFRDCDRIKSVDGVLRLCTNDLQLIALMTGSTLFDDATGTKGINWPSLSGACPAPFSFEWWSEAWDGASQGEIGGTGLYWHRAIPYNNAVYAGHTYERGLLVVTLNLKGRENPNITLNGPFDDWPTQMVQNGGFVAGGAFGEWRDTTLPDADCDYIAVTSAAS